MGIDPAARRIELDKFQEAIAAADSAKREIESQRDAAIRQATQAVNAEYRDRVDAAIKALNLAVQAKRDNIDATAAHPWDGKRVFKIEQVYNRWASKPIGERRIEGIVEVVRQTSQFAANLGWSRPDLGNVIVRKIKADGSPSLQFHKCYGKIESAGWKLAE